MRGSTEPHLRKTSTPGISRPINREIQL